jgi:hypothetical protein
VINAISRFTSADNESETEKDYDALDPGSRQQTVRGRGFLPGRAEEDG